MNPATLVLHLLAARATYQRAVDSLTATIAAVEATAPVEVPVAVTDNAPDGQLFSTDKGQPE
ncbi:MAG TPA: hypothetical protein VM578_07000 [Candidatus Saccharimonadales bacterium]|nr:hypothetical protein [Candidatus Saccharimonadales bacterium]